MGNTHKGEVGFKADPNAAHSEREVEFTLGKKVYTLAFSINAMCEMESALGGNVVELANMLSDPAKMSIKTMRTVFWAGLRDHHEALTEVESGRVMNDLGLAPAAEMIVKAFTLAFPEAQAPGPLPLTVPAPERRKSTGKAH